MRHFSLTSQVLMRMRSQQLLLRSVRFHVNSEARDGKINTFFTLEWSNM